MNEIVSGNNTYINVASVIAESALTLGRPIDGFEFLCTLTTKY